MILMDFTTTRPPPPPLLTVLKKEDEIIQFVLIDCYQGSPILSILKTMFALYLIVQLSDRVRHEAATTS